MNQHIEVQWGVRPEGAPGDEELRRFAAAALETPRSLTLRIVDEAEGRALNGQFRGKDKATNVLSFPNEPMPGEPDDYLGDIAICAAVVAREAAEQGKTLTAHWAHLVVHGVLHLQGYDHQDETEATVMEAREIEIVMGFGFPHPYESD